MSGPVEYNQMPREPAPAMIVEPNHSEQPRLVEPMKMEQSTSLRGGKADGGAICCVDSSGGPIRCDNEAPTGCSSLFTLVDRICESASKNTKRPLLKPRSAQAAGDSCEHL
ncbi:hypothetical protein CGMCC3_g7053 [Colletotrichum fructicola]|nr:uncharacterized protein CGMCC3_g7053 [Colletotrichum fructicola]KAE9576834.1 hypothetical protein CGMCC3_g7053 [Colletotrichum fructicola]